jgi:hypothetical protein
MIFGRSRTVRMMDKIQGVTGRNEQQLVMREARWMEENEAESKR